MIWTPQNDAKLLAGVRAGLSASQIAPTLGTQVTRNMVIARHARLRGMKFPSDINRGKRAKEQTAQKRRAYHLIRDELFEEYDRRTAKGEPREWVAQSVVRRGLRQADLARHVGYTREYIRQWMAAA